MRNEFSAGGVVIKKEDKTHKILLCFQEKLSGQKVYCLPKGHIEEGETPENTAIREVLEETGIKAINPRFLDKIDYFFIQNQEKVKKTVYFYLMDYESGDFQPNRETINIGWFHKEEAILINPYPTEKKNYRARFSKDSKL